ncbi:MAG TPA: DUF1501 domain-containing protein [Gammaproteobacteria bacterium]|nr:DUF1501 domain-containing protein [Gammaproteobacteria bacterium]HIM70860.1 DUF1501 domain-containing protein [Gammaproteobacteria bacterium]
MKTQLCSRRHMLHTSAFGLGSVAASWLLKRDGLLAEESSVPVKPELEQKTYDLLPKQPHHDPKAKAMISMFMLGGPSQIDLFDPKPELLKHNGKTFSSDIKFDNPAQASREIMAPLWKFKPHGQCGMELSELVPYLGGIADDITLIRSMHTGANNHIPSNYALNTGRATSGRAVLGSWLSSALGSETQELPAYVALTDTRGLPLIGGENWSNGKLPSIYQGTMIRPVAPRIFNLDPPVHLKGYPQEEQLRLLAQLNNEHFEQHPGENDLEARMKSYGLAARMQVAAREAFDITGESESTRKMYGIDQSVTRDYGTRCLIARRLVERGVRFVQILCHGQVWDHHGSIKTALPQRCVEVDKPAAALVHDLKEHGLLDSTIVHWGGEMGRLPVVQFREGLTKRDKVGRDHNTYGFSMWVAGGGFRKGYIHGQTDEFSHYAVDGIIHHYDWLATVLHQFGLDHKRLKFQVGPRELKLVESPEARVASELLA